MSALDGIRIRVEASTGLHDRPLHYQGNEPHYTRLIFIVIYLNPLIQMCSNPFSDDMISFSTKKWIGCYASR